MKTVLLLVGFVLASIHIAEAQQPAKIPRIAYLSGNSHSANATRTKVFREGLRQLGYIEGENIAIEYRYAEGKLDRLPQLAAELVRHKLDTIVASGGDNCDPSRQVCDPNHSHRHAGSGIDPVVAGLVESLARPGGNVTGFTSYSRELAGKRLELFKEAVPKVARVAVLYETANQSSAIEVKEVLPVAARALGLTIQAWELRAADDFDRFLLQLGSSALMEFTCMAVGL